jgi:leucyl-tRNA synthetase
MKKPVKKKNYNHLIVEKKWQKEWSKKKAFKTQDPVNKAGKKKKFYVLDMFPYPSGEGLHVGHPKGYIATDIISRMKRMQGMNVLHPMGFDAFGLPAENYAIKNKTNPEIAVKKNVARFKKQLEIIGLDYDWSREVNTTDPNFYKWTQWIFLKLLEKGLAYESNEPVNWCPVDKTVLSNEDVENGKCERCGSVVEKRPIRQWVLRITDYAERLLSDLDTLDWPESIKESQRNWIGKSVGAEIDFEVWRSGEKIKVFTTRADTIFGATYLVLSPEHEVIERLWPQIENKDEVVKYFNQVKNKTEIDRTKDEKEKTGVELKGIHAINPVNNQKIPIWTADYVLASYGTGAVMGVPAHDERDGAFAKKFNLPIIKVIDGEPSEEVLVNSGDFTGMPSQKARVEIVRFVRGRIVTKYKLRDWVFSRQRYWGEPIPVLRDGSTIIPVKEKDLPVKLPKVKSYEPTGEAESPLAAVSKWINVKHNGKNIKRESNTMPQWAGSSWYYLRYMDPNNKKALVDKKKDKYWNMVDLYVGGAEHATRHLIYARFWHKFLYDIGVVSTKEPFKKLQSVGLIIASDGRKMSKRFGNVINPDEIIKNYGADTLRMYEMFMGPFDQTAVWNEDNIFGVRRFLERVWRLSEKVKNVKPTEKFEILLNKTVKKVTDDIDAMGFNTAVSSMMILLNEMERLEAVPQKSFETFLKILSPFAPHMTEELWHSMGNKKLLVLEAWPKADPKKLQEVEVKIAVQINGKVRGECEVNFEMTEDEIVNLAKLAPGVDKWLIGKTIVKVIYVKNRLVNFVIN